MQLNPRTYVKIGGLSKVMVLEQSGNWKKFSFFFFFLMPDNQVLAILQATSLSMSKQGLHQMFEQFLSYQVANTISKAESKNTANLDIFSSNGRNTKFTYKKLEYFIITLNLKIALSMDCYPTEVS